ncbi:MAG: valine--tRNA ligase, partial [Candidatus Magasanikbacteria bacterium CG10_big_fil_rev_8_21_14_0_10_43_6]
MKELEKAYEPQKYEDDIYKKWEESGLFNPDVCIEKGVTREEAESYTIVLPPPNVTGTLHMGHAAMLAIEDVMIRYNRMKGKKTLWVPGTDHAAVATESKVERMLIKEGMSKPKEELGKDAFMQRVHQFAQESHDTIVNQAKKMGASLDWSREAFTLDEVRNKAVRMVFKKMFDDGLIYRGYRVINWSVKGQSTCSDDELVHVERPATLYTFKYSKEFPITIATTRPETKLGDTAVAVHPDGRWKHYIGQEFTIENFGQEGHTLNIKVFGDEHVDDDFGTGALGVTTAHSPIDFEMYEKQKALGNDIGLIQVIGKDGNMTEHAGSAYAGLSVKEARTNVVEWLRSENLLEQEEDIIQNVGTSDRFKDVVEPIPMTQWFIDVNKKFVLPTSNIEGIADGQEVSLKELMQQVVHNKQIDIVPERFHKTYFSWIDNLRDWCISRQIWYGHQIPVWYKGDEVFCDVLPPEGEDWEQDTDTLDTWFSSGLWTFSTLLDTHDVQGESLEAWLARSKDYATFHPTQVLETGYDIIFFWVARMILMTTYTLGCIPFETVYLHGMVRDEKGRKMSKSLDNIINPLDMIEKFGTDATRLSLLIGSTPGNDVKLSEEKIAGFRNFTNKLWNISRFMLMNIPEPKMDIGQPEAATEADSWILAELNYLVRTVGEDMDTYMFSQTGERLREFTWSKLADWYLEVAKVEGDKHEILNFILNTLLKLWHPFMPFATEAIWQKVYGEGEMLLVAPWPDLELPKLCDTTEGPNFNLIMEIITTIRSLRSEKGIDPGKMITVILLTKEAQAILDVNASIIRQLARVESLTITDTTEKTHTMVSSIVGLVEVVIDIADSVDIDAEKQRLEKEIAHVEPFVVQLEKKLR